VKMEIKTQQMENGRSRKNFLLCFLFSLLIFPGCSGLGLLQDRLAPKQVDKGKILFRYYSPSAKTVTVAGEFNGWEFKQDQSRTVYLKKNEKDIWEALVSMGSGRYHYKFVIDYQSWVLDSNNPLTEDDGTGNLNSLIIVK